METRSDRVPGKVRSGNGCLIAVLIVGGLFLLGAAALAIATYRFAKSKEGKAVMAAIGEGVQGARAPGAAEVRNLGCQQAMVIRTDRIFDAMSRPSDAGSRRPHDFPATMVACMAARGRAAPSCAAVAATYVKALGGTAAGTFAVMVKEQAASDPECYEFYSKKGEPAGPAPEPAEAEKPDRR